MSVADSRERMLEAGRDILERAGADGLTTRAVCDATGVKAPTLYHHFGSKEGLVEAIIGRALEDFFARKRALALTEDPMADLRRGWESWIGFALEQPTLFRLMIEARLSDARATGEAYAIMRRLVDRVATAGGLREDPDTVARAIWAASNGVLVMFLQGAGEEEIKATAGLMFDALLARVANPGAAKAGASDASA